MEMDSETQEGDMPDMEGQYLSINDRSSNVHQWQWQWLDDRRGISLYNSFLFASFYSDSFNIVALKSNEITLHSDQGAVG